MQHVYNTDLQPLINIIDNFDLPEPITSQDLDDIRESIQLIIENYMQDNFLEYRCENFPILLYAHIYKVLENIELVSDINVEDFINEGIYLYMNLIIIPRSIDNPDQISPRNRRDVNSRLKILREKDQHEQRTLEWFEFRWKHITASSAWKAFESEKTVNQLMYSKCLPINSKKRGFSVTSAAHHGHKYEPLSTIIYENENNTEIEEFGCLEHDTIHFLAASPDGINVDPKSKKYGRLLEIKNPVSRVIKGIPKKEYWVQMQLQMAVAKLYICDFLETQFKEYENEEQFLADGTYLRTVDTKRKGIIICFNDGNGPVYKYPPLDLCKEDCENWIDKQIEDNPNFSWINNSYWKLDVYSCITVRFNKEWFEKAIPIFSNTWDNILTHRKNGYNHLKPNSRKKKIKKQPPTLLQQLQQSIIKIRTESFDNTNINENSSN
jgi:putative phage-type endonuclease